MSKPKSSVPATTKALQAWQSELRRLEKRLEEWANALAEREENLEQQEEAFADALDMASGEEVQRYADSFPPDGPDDEDGDCGCTPEDAEAGCDCPKCEDRRIRTEAYHSPTIITDRRPYPGDKGDEVQWLDNLWKLEDKRKK
jgi:hypothetical protein